jgi:hypothetical protein
MGDKRRDDSARTLSLAEYGWASFLSHDGTRCIPECRTCHYWRIVWNDQAERKARLATNLAKIHDFRRSFSEFEEVLPTLRETLPGLLTKLYSDCQSFAEMEIKSRLEDFLKAFEGNTVRP